MTAMTEDQTLRAIANLGEDDAFPSAEAVAFAVVAAASVTGEDALTIDGGGWLRLRLPAVKALRVFYPAISWDRLGALVGLEKPVQPRVITSQKAAWWEDVGEPAYEAACEALEAL